MAEKVNRRVLVKDVTLFFVNLTECDKKGKYGASVALDKDDHAEVIAQLHDVALSTLRERFGEEEEAALYKMPFHDADKEKNVKNPKGKKYQPEYENKVYFGVSTRQPGDGAVAGIKLMDEYKRLLDDKSAADALYYSGGKYHVLIEFYTMPTKNMTAKGEDQEGVAVSLVGAMFSEHGTRIGNGGISDSELADAFSGIEAKELTAGDLVDEDEDWHG